MMQRTTILISALTFCAFPAAAKECRMQEPHSIAAPIPTDCSKERLEAKPGTMDHRALKGENGFVDLGNGTKVRINGRVRVDTVYKP